jgi:hypothetical protein
LDALEARVSCPSDEPEALLGGFDVGVVVKVLKEKLTDEGFLLRPDGVELQNATAMSHIGK